MGCTREAMPAARLPPRYPSPSEVQCSNNGKGPDAGVSPCCIYSRGFRSPFTLHVRRSNARSVVRCVAAAIFQALGQISLCASAAQTIVSQPSSPRYDTIAAAVLGHVRGLVPAYASPISKPQCTCEGFGERNLPFPSRPSPAFVSCRLSTLAETPSILIYL